MSAFKLPKKDILTSKKEIDALFAQGKPINLPPLRIIYLFDRNTEVSTKVLFTVPSRVFRKAVERNLLKRRMREAFRIHRHSLMIPANLRVAYIYIAKKVLSYSDIEKKIIQSFQKLKNEMEE